MIRWKDFECNLQSDYKDGAAKILETDYKLMNYNVDSNGIRVTVKDGAEDYVFDSVNDSVDGYVLCSNGQTYQAETVDMEGNQAWFIVPPDVYNFPGPCIVSILIVTGTVQSVAVAARMSVERIVTLPVLSPTSVVANITTVTALLDTLVAAKEAALAAAGDAEEAAENVGANLATEYSPSGSYVVGDYCINEGLMYRCTTDTDGEFDPACWDHVKVADELQAIIENIPIATVAETETYLGI